MGHEHDEPVAGGEVLRGKGYVGESEVVSLILRSSCARLVLISVASLCLACVTRIEGGSGIWVGNIVHM